MGASESQPLMEQLAGYRIIQKIPQNNITHLSHIETDKQYLLRELTYNDEKLYQRTLDEHKQRQAITDDHLIHLGRVQGKQIDHLCSNLYKVYAIWEYPFRFLSDEINERSYQNRRFEDKEISSILASSIFALSTLQKNKIKHEMLTTRSILLDSDGLVKIADPLACGGTSNFDTVHRNRHVEQVYISPEQCEALELRGAYSNPYKSDVWILGLIILECGLLESMSKCYRDQFQRIDFEMLNNKIYQFGQEYGEELRLLVEQMLKYDNKDRPDWIDLAQYARKFRQAPPSANKTLTSLPLQQHQHQRNNYSYESGSKQDQSSYLAHQLSSKQPKLQVASIGDNISPHSNAYGRSNLQTTKPSLDKPIGTNTHVTQVGTHFYAYPGSAQGNGGSALTNLGIAPTYNTNNPNTYTMNNNSSSSGRNMSMNTNMNMNMSSQPQEGRWKSPASQYPASLASNSNPGSTYQPLFAPTPYHNLPVPSTNTNMSTITSINTITNTNTGNLFPSRQHGGEALESWRKQPQLQATGNANINTLHSYHYGGNAEGLLSSWRKYQNIGSVGLMPSSYTTATNTHVNSSSNALFSNGTGRDIRIDGINAYAPSNNYADAFAYSSLSKPPYGSYLPNLRGLPPAQSSEHLFTPPNFLQSLSMPSSSIAPLLNNKFDVQMGVGRGNQKKAIEAVQDRQPIGGGKMQISGNDHKAGEENKILHQAVSNTQSLEQHMNTVQSNSQNTYLDMQNGANQENEIQDKPQFVVQTFRQGSKYEGFKLRDMRHGPGKFYYQDGGMYDGMWKKNKMHGFGSLYYQSGELAYQGMWEQDKFQGKGKLFNQYPYMLQDQFDYHNFDQIDQYWSYYEGDFVQDFKKGEGKLMLSNGEYFEGTFNNDMVEGPGNFYCKNGKIVKGIWRQNHFVSV